MNATKQPTRRRPAPVIRCISIERRIYFVRGQNLRSQIVTSSWGGRRYLPFVFTEQGVAMLSSVLKSDRPIQVNIAIMRAFLKLRAILDKHRELAQRLEDLELKYQRHDGQIREVFEAIRALLDSQPQRRPIGFRIQPPAQK